MIEINWTFFVQLANFLFNPILKNVEKREAKLKAFTLDAEKLSRRTEELVVEYDAKLEEAKKRTSDTIHKAKHKAGAEQERIIQEARKDFSGQIDKAMVDIAQYAENAEKELKKEADAISAGITSKIMGKN